MKLHGVDIMKNIGVNILIKFNDEEMVVNDKNSTTMLEHLNVMNQMGKVIWGQGSHRIKKLADNKVKLINKEIENRGYIYIVFVTSKNLNKKRNVYIGRCVKLFEKGDLSTYSEEVKYIPKYYSNIIGTDNDDNIVLFEINQFISMNEEALNDLYLLSNKDQQVMKVNNMNSLFYITMTKEVEDEIYKRFELKNRRKIESLLMDENYQNDVENSSRLDVTKIEESKGKYTTKSSEKFRRDAVRGRQAIIKAEYKCEVDGRHEFFISSVTGENYVEAHHLVPVEYSDLFNGVNIDVEENIISLCVVCHKKLHHGNLDDIIPILTKLYNERNEGLEKKGIIITLEELINLYV